MLKKIFLAVVIVIVLFLGIGMLLPRQIHVERSTVINAPAATVFAIVNDLARFNEWSPWHALDPNTQYRFEGPDSGEGMRMAWNSENDRVGKGTQEIILSEPDKEVRIQLDFGDLGDGMAAYLLTEQNEATEFTWTFDTELGFNPLERYFGLMLDSVVGKDYENGLAALKMLAEGEAGN